VCTGRDGPGKRRENYLKYREKSENCSAFKGGKDGKGAEKQRRTPRVTPRKARPRKEEQKLGVHKERNTQSMRGSWPRGLEKVVKGERKAGRGKGTRHKAILSVLRATFSA